MTLSNIIKAIRASALRNRYVAQRGFRGTSLEMKTAFRYGQICHHYKTDMSVVAERVVAPHGWLRYVVERIRSVRHLTDPEHRPGDLGEYGFYARRHLGLRLSTALSYTK